MTITESGGVNLTIYMQLAGEVSAEFANEYSPDEPATGSRLAGFAAKLAQALKDAGMGRGLRATDLRGLDQAVNDLRGSRWSSLPEDLKQTVLTFQREHQSAVNTDALIRALLDGERTVVSAGLPAFVREVRSHLQRRHELLAAPK